MTERRRAPLTEEQIEQLQLDYQGRAGSLLAVDDHVGELVETLAQDRPARATR